MNAAKIKKQKKFSSLIIVKNTLKKLKFIEKKAL